MEINADPDEFQHIASILVRDNEIPSDDMNCYLHAAGNVYGEGNFHYTTDWDNAPTLDPLSSIKVDHEAADELIAPQGIEIRIYRGKKIDGGERYFVEDFLLFPSYYDEPLKIEIGMEEYPYPDIFETEEAYNDRERDTDTPGDHDGEYGIAGGGYHIPFETFDNALRDAENRALIYQGNSLEIEDRMR
jgi:hypothetical protein